VVYVNVGYELEAAIPYKESKKIKKLAKSLGFKCGYDGSIDCEDGEEEVYNEATDDYDYIQPEEGVEFRSKIYFGANQKNKSLNILNDFSKVAKKVCTINDSMGLHFHVSLKNRASIKKLFTWEFVKAFQAAYKRKFTSDEEIERIDNDYCEFYQDKEDFENTLHTAIRGARKNNSRYKCINFNAYKSFKTIEFRIFPATNNPKKFEKYMLFTVNFVNDYYEKVK